jgi:TorA maturation chaperone TorD
MLREQTTRDQATLNRAKVYGFLSSAFIFPHENWSEDVPYAVEAARELNYLEAELPIKTTELPALQSEYLRTIGVSGALTYETEYGLENSYRQSHELADINGFYRAFGFDLGGMVRERPDHLAAELEFMHLLALKEWNAATKGDLEAREICLEAQRKFLEDHLGRWIEAFAIRLAFEAQDSLHSRLAGFAVAFVKEDAARLDAHPEPLVPQTLKPTPFELDSGCEGCPIPDGIP